MPHPSRFSLQQRLRFNRSPFTAAPFSSRDFCQMKRIPRNSVSHLLEPKSLAALKPAECIHKPGHSTAAAPKSGVGVRAGVSGGRRPRTLASGQSKFGPARVFSSGFVAFLGTQTNLLFKRKTFLRVQNWEVFSSAGE